MRMLGIGWRKKKSEEKKKIQEQTQQETSYLGMDEKGCCELPNNVVDLELNAYNLSVTALLTLVFCLLSWLITTNHEKPPDQKTRKVRLGTASHVSESRTEPKSQKRKNSQPH